ncbi:hypothetical protein P154DRAFT_536025 [Amniculicola lignicola CBS 123094]|uniref:Uncharacterized protein n=1 Tax=Amniculicola lignicola CBS 123094 TaxID=1392246 RepID=A0A6A5WAK5_9PLEO|nr:hypothetical protein P154DRAFT_536025 [Amniculicola lignicola CBS 123094]
MGRVHYYEADNLAADGTVDASPWLLWFFFLLTLCFCLSTGGAVRVLFKAIGALERVTAGKVLAALQANEEFKRLVRFTVGRLVDVAAEYAVKAALASRDRTIDVLSRRIARLEVDLREDLVERIEFRGQMALLLKDVQDLKDRNEALQTALDDLIAEMPVDDELVISDSDSDDNAAADPPSGRSSAAAARPRSLRHLYRVRVPAHFRRPSSSPDGRTRLSPADQEIYDLVTGLGDERDDDDGDDDDE